MLKQSLMTSDLMSDWGFCQLFVKVLSLHTLNYLIEIIRAEHTAEDNIDVSTYFARQINPHSLSFCIKLIQLCLLVLAVLFLANNLRLECLMFK